MALSLRGLMVTIIFGLIIASGLYGLAYSTAVSNNVTVDPAMEEVFNNYSAYRDTSYSEATGLQKETESTGEKLDSLGGEASVIKTVYKALKSPFNQLKIVQSTISITAKTIGLPKWLSDNLLAIVIIVLTAIILGIITRTGRA